MPTKAEIHELLRSRYPRLFRGQGKVRPLALGIDKALRDDLAKDGLSVSRVQLKKFLADYTRTDDYLKAIAAKNSHRYPLQGEPIPVDPPDRLAARIELSRRFPAVQKSQLETFQKPTPRRPVLSIKRIPST